MPIRQHAALLPAMQMRVTALQRTYVLLLAERQNCSVSEAVRRLIDAALDSEPPIELGDVPEGEGAALIPASGTMQLRQLLEMADHENVEPDPAWLAAYGDGQ